MYIACDEKDMILSVGQCNEKIAENERKSQIMTHTVHIDVGMDKKFRVAQMVINDVVDDKIKFEQLMAFGCLSQVNIW